MPLKIDVCPLRIKAMVGNLSSILILIIVTYWKNPNAPNHRALV